MNLAQYAITLDMHSRAARRTLRWSVDRLCSELNEVERCGAILVNGSRIEIPNRHPEPKERFRMERRDIDNRLHLIEVPVFAWWHTHYAPEDNPLPSKADLASIGSLVGAVIHCASGSITLYNQTRTYLLPC